MFSMSTKFLYRCSLGMNSPICQFNRCFSVGVDFKTAQARLKTLEKEPSEEVKLKLYSLYQQASLGDAMGKRPGVIDLDARAKFDAWKTLIGIPKEAAMKQYTELVEMLLAKERLGATEGITLAELKKVSNLEIAVDNRVLRIVLSRPKKYNALTPEMYEGIASALSYANMADDVAVTVMSAKGDYFSAGNDLSLFAKIKTPEDFAIIAEKARDMFERYVQAFIKHEKPLLIFIHQPAVGIAVTTLGLADLALASDKATFSTPFSPLGYTPEGCSTYTFPLLMGPLKSAEILTFNRTLTAQEAFERNLVNEVIPASSFESEAQKRLDAILQFTPDTLRLSKMIQRSVHMDALLETNRREAKLLKERWLSKDSMDAIMKFMKRKS